ncbi:hypothetical protein CAPTEDRAFT_213475, partial [Capitella teleta]
MSESRLKAGSTLIDSRGEIEGNHGLGYHYPVYDPVLSYIAYSLLTSPAEYTKLSKQWNLVSCIVFHSQTLRLGKLEARMAVNENLCAENNCCIAGKSPARPSTERRISQPATHYHNDANKTHEWTTQNQRSLKTQEQRPTRPKRSQRICGTAAEDSSAKLSTGPGTVMMQITNVSPVVTTNELKEYVLAKEDSLSSISIEDKTGDGWETKRLVLTIPRSAETTVLDPGFWPSDTFTRKWFRPRKPKSKKLHQFPQ